MTTLIVEVTDINVSVPDQIVAVYVVEPFALPSSIPVSVITEEGSFPVGYGSGSLSGITESLGPSASGQVWVSDLALPKKGKWAVPAAAGTDQMTNKSANSVSGGAVVTRDDSDDKGFYTTTTASDETVIGVAAETIGINAAGAVKNAGIATVNVKGNVTRGHFLVTDTTAGFAKDGGVYPSAAVFAIALTSYTGTSGTVEALLLILVKKPAAMLINEQTDSYTTTDADNGKLIRLTKATGVTLTIHQAAAQGFNCLVEQGGAGQVTVAAGGTGALINYDGHTKLAGIKAFASCLVLSNAGTAPQVGFQGRTA